MVKHNVLYIHGFNSSPLSIKAEQARMYFAKYYPNVHFICPQLANTPSDAIEQLEKIIESQAHSQWHFIGSSLGGYFSHYLAVKYQVKTVLVNPAIKPYELLNSYLGKQINPYTDEVFYVTKAYVKALKSLEQISPNQQSVEKNNYLVMVQTGDEVLDYQQAVDKFTHCRLLVQQGGDHSFIGFERKLPDIAAFFQLT